jgi:hypothetical protein
MEEFIPKSLHARVRVDGQGTDSFVNPLLYTYAFQWLWRHNLGEKRRQALEQELVKLCRQQSA